MMKFLVIIALAVTVHSAWDGNVPNIPGISAENMAKLRQMLNPPPANNEAWKQVMERWRSTLSATEKAAADTYREQMIRQRQQQGK